MISTTHNLEMIPTHNLEFPLMFQKLFHNHHFRPSPFVILVLLFDTAQKNVAAALQFGCIATLDKPVKLELPGTPYFLADTLPLAITMAVHHAHQVRVFLFRPNLPTNATATTYAARYPCSPHAIRSPARSPACPPSSPESDRLAALKEEARATVEATTQRKTKRCNKEKLDRAGKVIVKCRYGTKCRFLHQGDYVRARTPAHVIERMVDLELARMLASMKTK